MSQGPPMPPKYWQLEWASIKGFEDPPFWMNPEDMEISKLAKEGESLLEWWQRDESDPEYWK